MNAVGTGLARPTFVSAFRSRVETSADEVPLRYLVDGEHTEVHASYRQLDLRARGIAAALRAAFHGQEPEPVLLLAPPGPEFVAGFLGCAYAGAVVVPCYPPSPRRLHATVGRMAAIVADTGARLALTAAEALPALRQVTEQQAAFAPVTWLCTDGPECDPGADAGDAVVADPGKDDLAFLQYTSGSTASPRGVMVSQRNLMANLRAIHEGIAATGRTTSVFWLPPYHDMGLVTMLHALVSGAEHISLSPLHFLQRPVRWLRALSRYRATVTGGPNFALDLCVSRVSAEERRTLDLSALDILFCGSEPIRTDTVHRFTSVYARHGLRSRVVVPVYGLAESTLFVAGATPGEAARADRVSRVGLAEGVARAPVDDEAAVDVVDCGYPRSDHHVLVVDPDRAEPLPDGRVGEIWCAGPSVAVGYWRAPDHTAQVFAGQLAGPGEHPRWLRTGDLGYRRAGRLYVTGRRKDLVIVRGRNHYPQDIERTVSAVDPIIRPGGVAAFAVDSAGPERLAVVCEVAEPPERPAALIDAVRQAVATEHDVEPSAVLLVPARAIPKTSSGKVQRSACRQLVADRAIEIVADWSAPVPEEPAPDEPDGPTPGAGARATTPEVERWLVAWIAARLSRDAAGIDPDQALGTLGLDSLGVVQLTHDLGIWLDVALPPTVCWDHPSIRALAEHVAWHPHRHRPGGSGTSLADLLAGVEEMPDADVSAALAELDRGGDADHV